MAAEKILVLDDDAGLLTLMKARLEAAGYQVTLADKADDAINFVQQQAYHAAILDLKLDGADAVVSLLVAGAGLNVQFLDLLGCLQR